MTLDFSMSSLADGLNKKQTNKNYSARNLSFGQTGECVLWSFYSMRKSMLLLLFEAENLENSGIHPRVSWQTQVPVSWSVKQNLVPRGCGRGAAGLSLPRKDKLLSREQWCPEEIVYSTDLEAGPPSLRGQLTMVVSVLLDICCPHQCQARLWKDKDCFPLHW